MKRWDLSKIMKRAWEFVKKAGMTISCGLKAAWKEAKEAKEMEENMIRGGRKMKRFWIAENFRGQGYWVECPNIANAVERFGEEAVAISYMDCGVEHALILYPAMKFHITTDEAKIQLEYDPQVRKWIYVEGKHRFLLSPSRETIAILLRQSQEMLHK